LLPQWTGYINGLREKKSANDAADKSAADAAAAAGQSFSGTGGVPAFFVAKANAILNRLLDKYQDFQSEYLNQSTEMDLEFNQVTSKLPANAGAGGDKCDGIPDYKTWVYEYNKRLNAFRKKRLPMQER